ncbi:MAG: YbjN domain-containing protein [Clostridia bacterium]|nr:YbjN domain-containing protein [Clostridia bacterium]
MTNDRFCFTADSFAIKASDYNKALATVNKFNLDYRYPKAFVMDDYTFACDGDLMGTTDLTTGVVEEFIDNMIFGTGTFLDTLSKEGWDKFGPYKK